MRAILMSKTEYSLMIHGGAGAVANQTAALSTINDILRAGQSMLKSGGHAVDTVEYCVELLENTPLFNSGRGAVLNHEGQIDLDASIMDGRDLNAGAIAGVTGIKNPVKLARAVMDKSDHVFLISHGAEEFARKQGLEFESEDYFRTPDRVKQWKDARAADKIVLDHTLIQNREKKYGTVGAVAFDKHGDLAAATSTGGIVNKKIGRVGDSPVIGAGVYAENGICAISATGYGEQFLRTVISKHTAEIIRYEKTDAVTAAKHGIEFLIKKVNGLGGLIVVDANGNCGWAYSTPGMIFGLVTSNQPASVRLK